MDSLKGPIPGKQKGNRKEIEKVHFEEMKSENTKGGSLEKKTANERAISSGNWKESK